jgi:ATPase subunit of ABC transporter with duplicated ATPase domains
LPTPFPSIAPATLRARGISHSVAGHVVLDDVSLVVGPRERLGVVGPNGVGKSTLLRILAGLEEPEAGSVETEPPWATVGWLAQESARGRGETGGRLLRRLTGVEAAESDLHAAVDGVAARERGAEDRYAEALERWHRLGSADFESRLAEVARDVGLSAGALDRPVATLSGGEAARLSLVAIVASSFDITLLDEPTNDLDFAGIEVLEAFVSRTQGGMVIVSHDRELLDRTVTTVLELDESSHRARLYSRGWKAYVEERATDRRHAEESYEVYLQRRSSLLERAARERRWATRGVAREKRTGRDADKVQRDFRLNRTEQLAARARRTEKALERLEPVGKPWVGWQLRVRIAEAGRAGSVVVRLDAAVVERGSFRLGPLDLVVGWGDRIGLRGPNGAGKTSLIAAVLGHLPLSAGARWLGPSVVAGVLGQDRARFRGAGSLLESFTRDGGSTTTEARSLLAKFGLGAEDVTRPAATLSPGERTRAELAWFQARGVNFLVLDEPTNHLDLLAVEQLESALAGYSRTLVVVSHDRRFLESVELTRTVELERGRVVPSPG